MTNSGRAQSKHLFCSWPISLLRSLAVVFLVLAVAMLGARSGNAAICCETIENGAECPHQADIPCPDGCAICHALTKVDVDERHSSKPALARHKALLLLNADQIVAEPRTPPPRLWQIQDSVFELTSTNGDFS